jgi:hypothetical protein
VADLFGAVLGLCVEAGLVEVGVIAIDGTKLHANASERATCDYEQLAREILADADAVGARRTHAWVSAAATNCPISSPQSVDDLVDARLAQRQNDAGDDDDSEK